MSTSADPITSAPSTGSGNVARLVDRLSRDITSLQTGAPKRPPKPNNNNNRTAHVRFSYVAQQEDELTIDENDTIEVLEDVEDGWAKGRLGEKIGLFPTNFVSFAALPAANNGDEPWKTQRSRDLPEQPIVVAPPTTTSAASTAPTAAAPAKTQAERTPSASSSNNSNILPSNFKANLRKSASNASTGSTTAASTSVNNNSAAPAKTAKEVAKVLYDYRATQPDELELHEGDTIHVLSRKCVDDGWCEGELNGRRGIFPENFVRFTTTAAVHTAAASASAASQGASSTAIAPAPFRMSASVSTAPPLLPAKPATKAKPAASVAPSASSAENGGGGSESVRSTTTPAASTGMTNTSTALTASAVPSTGGGDKASGNGNVDSQQAAVAGAHTVHSRGDTSTAAAAKNHHAMLEERKSMIAGLQSKLFPSGKMPPHKPTFQPNTKSTTGTAEGGDVAAGGQMAPLVQMRHSVVDPTSARTLSHELTANENVHDEGEARQLESLTKTRPKQPGKRPPSTHYRLSKLEIKKCARALQPNGREEEPPTPTTPPPLTPPAASAPPLPSLSTSTANTAPLQPPSSTTVFPATSASSSSSSGETRPPLTPPPLQPPSGSAGGAKASDVARELSAISAAVTSRSTGVSPTGVAATLGGGGHTATAPAGQRSSSVARTQPWAAAAAASSTMPSSAHPHSTAKPYEAAASAAAADAPTHAEMTISRREFDAFRADVLRRLARLEQLLARNEPFEPPLEPTQHL